MHCPCQERKCRFRIAAFTAVLTERRNLRGEGHFRRANGSGLCWRGCPSWKGASRGAEIPTLFVARFSGPVYV